MHGCGKDVSEVSNWPASNKENKLRRWRKLQKLGQELTDALLKPGRIVVNRHLGGSNVVTLSHRQNKISAKKNATLDGNKPCDRV